MIEKIKQAPIALIILFPIAAVVPFLGARWWDAFSPSIANFLFPEPYPTAQLLTTLLPGSLSLLLGYALGQSWHGREIELIPDGYILKRQGAVLYKPDKTQICSVCFFQDRREIPLKENRNSAILECVINKEHTYKEWET